MRRWPANDIYPGGADRDDVPREPELPVCLTCQGTGLVYPMGGWTYPDTCPQCEGTKTVTAAEAHEADGCDGDTCSSCTDCYAATGKEICSKACPHQAAMDREARR